METKLYVITLYLMSVVKYFNIFALFDFHLCYVMFLCYCIGTSTSRLTVHRCIKEGRKEMFYLTMHPKRFIYSYMATHMLKDHSDSAEETRIHHMGYSFQLAARVLLYAPSHRQDNTYHGLCYTSHGALAGARNGSMGAP